MKRTGLPVIGIALLMIAACKAQPEATPDNNATAEARNETLPANETAEPATEPSPADKDLRAKLIGSWVYSKDRPTGKAQDICATDAGITLDTDGSYGELYAEGKWDISHGVLTITVMRSSEASGGEEEPKTLSPPRIQRWSMETVQGDLASMRSEENGQFWMFRCPEASATED